MSADNSLIPSTVMEGRKNKEDADSDDSSEIEKNSAHDSDEEGAASSVPSSPALPESESIREYLARKFAGLKLSSRQSDEDQRLPSILCSLDVEGIVEYIKEGRAKNIICMAGAGISTSAGIPDFRTPGTGLYDNLQKYDLPYPTAVFDISYFQENPKPFFTLAKELYPGSFKPTTSHYFVKLLEQKKLLLRHFTQNIDTLERVAGISDDKIVEAHGAFHTGHCIKCRKEYSQEWIKELVFKDQIPTCQLKNCAGYVKPDIVFFGESLPERFFSCLKSDFGKCDLLIIIGTSLTVQPFASLIERVGENCPRLLINMEKSGTGSGGLMFDKAANYRDVALLGDCDSGCRKLAEKLGWETDLDDLMADSS